MILEIDPRVLFYGIPVTDWVEAFGGAVAVIAAFWAFIKLFTKNKDLENQIRSLSSIAEESQNQTRIMEHQAFQMQRQNELIAKQVDLQNESLSVDIKYREKLQSIEEEKRKTELIPFFTFKKSRPFIQDNKLFFDLINLGGDAIDFTYGHNTSAEPSMVALNPAMGVHKKNSETLYEIAFHPALKKQAELLKTPYRFKLRYKDVSGNNYEQQIEGKGSMAKITSPELVVK